MLTKPRKEPHVQLSLVLPASTAVRFEEAFAAAQASGATKACTRQQLLRELIAEFVARTVAHQAETSVGGAE